MPKISFQHIIERRHFWRYATFGEVAELYASRTLRIAAMYVGTGFASVYLYQMGFSMLTIMIFWACYFFFKIFLAPVAGWIASWFGPKHGILFSNLLYIPALIMLGSFPEMKAHLLLAFIVWGFFMALSTSLYQVSYLVDFSKVKSLENGGKELGYMNMFEKVTTGISPVLGGILALYTSPSVVMYVAAGVFLVAAAPLLRTVEQTVTKQHLHFGGFPWRANIMGLFSQVGIGYDQTTTGYVWSLFILIVVFPGIGDDIYVQLGILSSAAIIAALAISYGYGQLIDTRRGHKLLRYGVVGNALIHAARPFMVAPVSVFTVNVVDELATTGYFMPYMRGMFDSADLSGKRTIYLFMTDVFANIGATLACLVLISLLLFMGDHWMANRVAMDIFFWSAAVVTLLIGAARFQIYRR